MKTNDVRVLSGKVMCIDGYTVPYESKEISRANILRVTAGTNGYMGGDTGHGSRTFIRIEDRGGTDMRPRLIRSGCSNTGIQIVLGGDSELSTIVEALRFVADALERQADEIRTGATSAEASKA